MEYEIRYDLRGRSCRVPNKSRWMKYAGYILALTITGGLVLWALGVDVRVLVNAADGMAESLEQGKGIKDAFSGFCLDILQGSV